MAQAYILMLEDDADDRLITESFFTEQGYDVALQFVINAHEVMEWLDNCLENDKPMPKLIILDNNVPLGSGIDTLRELKTHSVYKAIPVVMVSGTAVQKEVEACYALGASSYIIKPATDALTTKKIATFFSYWFEVAELPQVRPLALS